MEDFKRNGIAEKALPMNQANHHDLSKRDKRKHQVASRLRKLELTFWTNRDQFYRSSLNDLLNALSSIHQGTLEEYLNKEQELGELRDAELVRLRLWEEYRVKRIDEEYREDLKKAQENHDKMIKLIKEKLYDKLQKQIKKLKEDKLLLNLVNANSWNGTDKQSDVTISNIKSAAGSIVDRRFLRKRDATLSRMNAGEIDDLSDGTGNSTIPGYGSTNSIKRRRNLAFSSNDEANTSSAHTRSIHGHGHGHGHGINHNNGMGTGTSSGNESNFSDKDYDSINNWVMQNNLNHVSLSIFEGEGGGHKIATRGSHKQFMGPQGLKPDELNKDLELLRSAVKKE